MKEHPILMNAEMVRAILDGRKTQTRRPVKPQPDMEIDGEKFPDGSGGWGWVPVWPNGHKWAGRTLGWAGCPFGQHGDRLWVRETWRIADSDLCGCGGDYCTCGCNGQPIYAASYSAGDLAEFKPWRPSIHMPRWASRITLEITGVRLERIQDISEADAIAEGAPWEDCWPTYRQSFEALWCRIYDSQSWDVNPWVWVVEFRRVQP